IGTEISGISLASLTDEQVREVERLAAERGVLFFRDQRMTLKDQVELGKRFGTGELHVHPNAVGPKGFPEVLPVRGDRFANRVPGEAWHTDVSCDRRPPALSILRIEQAPPIGGDTMWCSMTALYKKLPRQLRAKLEGLTAVHDSRTAGHQSKVAVDVNGKEPGFPRHVHPVIRNHPITGERALYVNSGFTMQILGVPEEESKELLRKLFDMVAYSAECQVRFKWTDHSVAIWDNRVVQHMATWTYYPYTRNGYRVTTLGEEP
ncbi:dioxygenase, partial [Hyaloraphidium curvatum]